MANKVLLKKSSVEGKVPLSSDLAYGEVALNYNDAALYYKRPDDSIDVLVSPELLWNKTSASLSSTTQSAVDVWDATKYRSAKYIVQITQGTDYQVSEMLVLHNGTSTVNTEYGIMYTNAILGTLSTDISSGQVRLLVTMSSNSAATINIKKTLV